MAEKNTTTAKIVVSRNEDASPAKRITEAQFEQCPSEWLGQAKGGQQIIVVDSAESGRVTMVLGLNGLNFQLPTEQSKASAEKRPNPEQNAWLK